MNQLQLKNLLRLAVLMIVAVPARAGSDFSGTWKLNLLESEFSLLGTTGTLFGPDKAVMKIEQDGPVIRIGLFQSGGTGEIKADLIYHIDGTECANTLDDHHLTTSLHWEGENLSVTSHMDMAPFYPELEDLWVLSEDGNKLTVKRRMNSDSGGDSQLWVFDRQQ